MKIAEANLKFPKTKDKQDTLFAYRERFFFPEHNGEDAIYFCGNSLGLQPRSVSYLMQSELNDWAKYGVEGHFQAKNPWFSYHHLFTKSLSNLVGALPSEVVAMNTLTVNLHLLLLSFYHPDNKRYKILMEAGAFPSDMYAIETHVRLNGLDPREAIVEVAPNKGSHTIDEDVLLQAIHQAGDSLAVVLIGGVNYYTGQYFNLEKITEAAHAVGAFAGFDLAHAVGNVPLQLHDWDVDFACWCSYKYLNSGPGSVGGAYIHDRFSTDPTMPRLAGWWGYDEKNRFKMKKGYVPEPGAAGWQMSNAPVFNMVAHLASLDLFESAGMKNLRAKSVLLTSYLEFLLKELTNLSFEIITPSNTAERGAQLSLLFKENGKKVYDALQAKGIIVDWREPNVIRIAPAPMYNNFEDVYKLYEVMKSLK